MSVRTKTFLASVMFLTAASAQTPSDAASLSPEYTPDDRKARGDGSAYTVKIVEPQLATVEFKTLHKLDCPAIMFLGRHDWVVPSAIAAEWLDQLTAPKKAAIWFENSAHMMMVEEPGRVLAALLEHVRPLAREGDASPGHP